MSPSARLGNQTKERKKEVKIKARLAIAGVTAVISLATPAAAFAATPSAKTTGNSGGTIFRNVGDWASHGCEPATWDGQTYFDAWATDNYTAEPVASQPDTYTEAGTFTAACDPTTGQQTTAPVNGEFHGQITYSSDGAMAAGKITYRAHTQWGEWVFTESMTSGAYAESENFNLTTGQK